MGEDVKVKGSGNSVVMEQFWWRSNQTSKKGCWTKLCM